LEVIFGPWEQKKPVDLHSHYYDALYMQALVTWLCAWCAGTVTEALVVSVPHVGPAVAGAWLEAQKEFKITGTERANLEYISMSNSPVWGSQNEDVFWKAF
jgi:hypothetical protein